MFIRSAVATLSGALALSALAVTTADADAGQGDTQVVQVLVNNGKSVVVGATTKKTITLSITARDNSGIKEAYGWLYHGSFDNPDGFAGPGSDTPLTCTPVPGSVTDSTCTASITIDPNAALINANAGTWHVWTSVDANDFDFINKDSAGTFLMKRAAKLTADASPEPVTAGKVITVKGTLSRANWDNLTYGGYVGQSAKLQFRKAGTTTYNTVKTVTSGAGGALKTTATASVDGYWRWSFAGTGTTGATSAAGDYVDVTAG
ncbi:MULTISPECIES: calcium-binding protein [unclassified Streptomyces]|uniref:calcium-binding protein n=1 Tax=unclassified Streptomyces TaxID=2593676 RepID=UPI002E81D5DA|nr:calcium-binding protein [Streptomyces sp. NBC_00589]WTI33833.1 calcium-binding protein [Streptomyces sp. NBC_00775]WUB32494.1 calcium-binding protein [Streptomyces sp. NBC_00589]